jgi:AcrR family transcriptional regulator
MGQAESDVSEGARAMDGKAAVPARRPRRDAAEIRAAILAAAAEEFEGRGFSGATTAAIARAADVTEAQIFRYFESKQALFRAAIFEELNRHFSDFHARQLMASEDSGDVRDRARGYITELQDFIAGHSRMLMSLMVARAYGPEGGSGDSGAVLEELAAYFERGAAMQRARLGDAAPVDPALMVRVSFAAVLGCALFRDWMFPAEFDDAAIRGATIEFVIDGLNANDDMPKG